ncbi:MAG: hypothetical protein WAW80_00130 [Candidatus Saccharimonadales bacterium]
MDPNQQPINPPTQPVTPTGSQPNPILQPQPPVSNVPEYTPQAPIPQPVMPQTPSSYSVAPQPAYDPNYLDSIAPPPPAPKFFSGSFAKIFYVMLALFFLAVSIIVALSGKDETADLQQMAVRLDKFNLLVKSEQKNLKSSNLSNTNTNFQIWLSGNKTVAEDLLKKGGVKKSQYSKTMMASESKISNDLTAKFADALLNAKLDRIYASSMGAESEKMINLFKTMEKKNKSKQIRDFAKTARTNLEPINKLFNDYSDDGTN